MIGTQNAMVLEHLQNHGPLTQLQALHKLGTMRLASRIFDLRSDGHVIHTRRIKVGRHRKVAEYVLIRSAEA